MKAALKSNIARRKRSAEPEPTSDAERPLPTERDTRPDGEIKTDER